MKAAKIGPGEGTVNPQRGVTGRTVREVWYPAPDLVKLGKPVYNVTGALGRSIGDS